MQHKLLAITFLLFSFPMYAMELTTTDYSNGIPFSDDLFITTVCSRLDRPARDTLRCTCKKYLALVHSQDELNENYKEACDKKDNLKMAYWRSLGWLLSHQEFANAIKSKKDKLAAWLLERNKVAVWDAYCLNIEEAVETSTVEEMVPVIQWLLDTRKPIMHHGEYLSGYHFANNLKGQYPEAQKIIDLFTKYAHEKFAKLVARGRRNIAGSGSGPWHARGDYY